MGTAAECAKHFKRLMTTMFDDLDALHTNPNVKLGEAIDIGMAVSVVSRQAVATFLALKGDEREAFLKWLYGLPTPPEPYVQTFIPKGAAS